LIPAATLQGTPAVGELEAAKPAGSPPAKKVEVFVPADPFDPEIFNRQFAPKP
jgi:hypothetical protein